jgi:hypothetical protein
MSDRPIELALLLDELYLLFQHQMRVPPMARPCFAGELATLRLRFACELLKGALSGDISYQWQLRLFLTSMERANLYPATLFVLNVASPQLVVCMRRQRATNLLRRLNSLSVEWEHTLMLQTE